MAKPHEYPSIPALELDTQLYTQRRTSSEGPVNYKFTVQDVLDMGGQWGYVKVEGTYERDADAIADGKSAGDVYWTAEENDYALPGGIPKKIA